MITSSASLETSSSALLQWRRLSDLPDPVGLKGAYAGLSAGWIVLAGGSNFPVPRSEGGAKAFANRIHVRAVTPADAPWRTVADVLPEGLAEGAAVSTEHGMVAIGGQAARGPVADVTLFTTDAQATTVRRTALPSLPAPSANAAAVYWQGGIYVAGGEAGGQGTSSFWRLDLAAALTNPAETTWQPLPVWPGPRRFGAMLVALQREGREHLYLLGGRIKAAGAASLDEYLADAYRYDPQAGTWAVVAAMPHRAIIATAVRIGAAEVAIMGGSDGHDLERMAELGERYRIPDHIAIYDAETDRWSSGGRMPIGVVGAAAVDLGSSWYVAGGEYSPSLRTPQAFELKVARGSAHEGAR